MKKTYLIFVLLVMVFSGTAFAASSVSFTWDTNDENDLAGYRIYQSNTSAVYDTANPAAEVRLDNPEFDHSGDRCGWTLPDVSDGTYFWVVTAFDGAGNESIFSNEVTATLDSTAPSAPTGVTVSVVVHVRVN